MIGKWHINNVKFRNKLFLSYLVVSIIPITIFSTVTFSKTKEVLENKVKYVTESK